MLPYGTGASLVEVIVFKLSSREFEDASVLSGAPPPFNIYKVPSKTVDLPLLIFSSVCRVAGDLEPLADRLPQGQEV